MMHNTEHLAAILPYSEQSESDPAGTRTQDPLLKREMLYQLSYGVDFSLNHCEGNGEYRK
jgi:hypothetical protein